MQQTKTKCSCGAPILIKYTLGGATYKVPTCNCDKKNKVPVALRTPIPKYIK